MAHAGVVGDLCLERIEHVEDLVGEPEDSGFGSLLFDVDGRLWRDADGLTRLYTTTRDGEGRWLSHVRAFSPATRAHGPAQPALLPDRDEDRAVIHHALRLADGRVLALYSNGRGVRAATAPEPDKPFTADPGFLLLPEAPWELRGSTADACSLEANGGYVKIDDTGRTLRFWTLYDSYHPAERRGELGWAEVAFDKAGRRLGLLGRHRANPLGLLKDGQLCARCGGNLASDLRLGGRRALFYYVRPARTRLQPALALADDPLFLQLTAVGSFDSLLGAETVIEKFQAYGDGGEFTLLYESKLANGLWRTGLRRYRADIIGS